MKIKATVLVLVLSLAASVMAAAPEQKTGAGKKTPKIDLVFCVDTTGSMGDEIDVVKDRMKDMIAKIAAGNPAPKVRVGIVAYRDRGDQYVVQKSPLTADIDAAVATVARLEATGGGDKEESVNEALHVAVSDMNWDRTAGITRLIYLIGDAGPHVYEQDFDAEKEREKALKDRIIINAIGCSGLESSEEAFFRKISQGAEGSFSFLTYREEYAKADGSRAVVLREGAKAYAYAPTASSAKPAADWKGGAAAASSSGAATEVSDSYVGFSTRPTTNVKAKDGWQINATTMNNLDVVMTQQAQAIAAKQQGIVYKKADLVPFLRELQGSQTGVKAQTLLVIRDKAAWTKLWAAHQSYLKKAEGVPKVDFSKEMVLVAASSGARDVVIREATKTDGKLVVNYAVTAAKGEASPFHFAVIPRSTATVKWIEGK